MAIITDRDSTRGLIPILASPDESSVKFLPLFLLTAALATAESHPSWWTYASPEATALVGIHWDNLRNSPFASAIEDELASTGPLAFPNVECLRQAREIVISSPELLAAEAGSFPSATVNSQAQRAGLHRSVYRGLTLWTPEQAAGLGIAQISEQIVLVGSRRTLQSAVDRNLLATGRQYSSLLPRAARFSQSADLWVVAVKLPDPLANLFVPLEVEAWGFEGAVSMRDGLSLEASFDASSTDAAEKLAGIMQQQAPTLPPLARGLQATSDRRTVNIQLQASQAEVVAALHAAPAVAPAAVAAVTAPQAAMAAVAKPSVPGVAPVAVAAAVAPPIVAAPEPPKPAEPPKPTEPQIIRIIGLDEGTREIRLPPSQ